MNEKDTTYNIIHSLYHSQLKNTADSYLYNHSKNSATIKRHIEAFDKYKSFLSGNILDWGCRHSVDGCLAKLYLNENCQIHACDTDSVMKYQVFSDFAKLDYHPLTHSYKLPYQDNSFDCVIGSGVLEHVPNDYESLKEVNRILKSSGYFIITFLPNKYSYTEFLAKTLFSAGHKRKYNLRNLKNRLIHLGFEPIEWGYHQFIPTLSGANPLGEYKLMKWLVEKMYRFNTVFECIWPFRSFSANLYVICKKVDHF